MPLDATDFGYVSMLRDNPSPADSTTTKVGGYCIIAKATSAMSPGNVVIIDTSAAAASSTVYPSVTTTASANSTAGAGFYVASYGTTPQTWDFTRTAASGDLVLVQVNGIVLATASTSISIGALVGTSTTAGQVVTTSTTNATMGRCLSTATTQGDGVYVLIGR